MVHLRPFRFVAISESWSCWSTSKFRDFRILYFSNFASRRLSKSAVSGISLELFKTKSDYKSFDSTPNPIDVCSFRPSSFLGQLFEVNCCPLESSVPEHELICSIFLNAVLPDSVFTSFIVLSSCSDWAIRRFFLLFLKLMMANFVLSRDLCVDSGSCLGAAMVFV